MFYDMKVYESWIPSSQDYTYVFLNISCFSVIKGKFVTLFKIMELQRGSKSFHSCIFPRDNHCNSLFYTLLLYIKNCPLPLKCCHNLNSLLMDIRVGCFPLLTWADNAINDYFVSMYLCTLKLLCRSITMINY